MYRIPRISKKICLNQITRSLTNNSPKQGNLKVAICGAAGQAGQAVALMLKKCPLIDELALYDIAGTGGIAMELSHIDTKCKVYSYKSKIKEALENAQIVAITASAPRLTASDKLTAFKPNAVILFDIISACAQYCPKAFIAIATDPVNSMVPLASEILKKHRVYNKNHVFGITTLDVMRANTFVAECQGLPAERVHVPVIGGHSKGTIIPVLSQTKPASEFSNEELVAITEWVQNATEDVIKEKKTGTPYLSGALAVTQFVMSLARAMKGEERVVECAFVRSDIYPNLKYLATPIELGIDGVQKNLGIPQLSDYEKCLLHNSVNILNEEIKMGEEFVGVKHESPKGNSKLSCKMNPCN